MKIIYNKHIPFKGFRAITILEWVFARSECKPLSWRTINHESIHIAQNREMLYLGFYIWYVCEFFVRLIQTKGHALQAYHLISFEREAYENDFNIKYLRKRKHYSWLRSYMVRFNS